MQGCVEKRYLVEGIVLLFKDDILSEDKTERVITGSNKDEVHVALKRILAGSLKDYALYEKAIDEGIDLYIKSGRVRKTEILRVTIPYKMYDTVYDVQFRVSIKLLSYR